MILIIADDDDDWTTATQKWLRDASELAHVQMKSFTHPDEMLSSLVDIDSSASDSLVVFLDLDFSQLGSSGFDVLAKMGSPAEFVGD
jgi:hypothetical protein